MQTFDTATPITAVLEIPAGRLQVIAADRADTAVEVRPMDPSKNRDVKQAEQTTVAYSDGVLRVETVVKHRILGSSGAVEVTVQLPAGSRVEATVAAAELRGVGRLGDVTFKGAAGDIKLDEAANVRLAVQAGDVSVGRLTGNAEVSAAKGDIAIAEAGEGSVVLSTQVGDLSVGAAPGVSAALDAGTTVGRIQNSLKNDGETALTVRATTITGDISAHSL
ncbi:DUF4097 family beta strand repeat-containing protein [Jiangella sp. DSM 45060]|uniref:DUF4097 family beta strand repeat-containing protein n=1 Tax=Jiangella sp. DSM 45060 TaxID=1798224 RepID=UPI00087A514F|nr:DUF4097 family beta strand repeat-containing protein [Jiangella sp. DSM 45060]SDS37669.1 Putative adhesin [Jiangella sp. DSM 45060]